MIKTQKFKKFKSTKIMKALVRYSHLPKKLKIKEIPFPNINNLDDEAIIEVKFAGICGRDLEHYNSKISKKSTICFRS